MSEDAFFAVPPGGEPEMINAGDAPILLGAPAEGAGEPTFLGDVNEAPPTVDNDVLGGGDLDSGIPPVSSSGEPGPMQVWNAEWQETLLKRKDEENARKAQLVEEARVSMEKFHSAREQKREAKMAANRSDEQSKLEAIEADLENDNSWQRVCKMIELSHDNKADAEDVKRMRDVLILLKNEPARAAALIN